MISYIVCASIPTGVWHRRIKYIRAHSEPDISQSPSEMWQEGLNEQELREYLDA